MACTKDNCIVNGNERMVSCWLCLKPFHLKCSGLKARDADALADPQKFLNWTCPVCRKISIEFYNLFKNSKEKFEKISEEFQLLQNKLAQFGELFTSYPNLDKYVSNTTPTSSQLSCSNLPESFNKTVMVMDPPLSSTSPSLGHAVNEIPAVSVIDNCSPCKSSYVEVATPLQQSQLALPATPSALPLSRNGNYLTPSTQDSAVKKSGPKSLRALPPCKFIFVSRLSSETTAEDVEFYVKSKLRTNGLISVYKYAYSQPRAISSFKITVPDELFSFAVDPTFWPVHTFVREYQNRKPAAHLPLTKN